jgi:hypothetical protein
MMPSRTNALGWRHAHASADNASCGSRPVTPSADPKCGDGQADFRCVPTSSSFFSHFMSLANFTSSSGSMNTVSFGPG